MPEIRALIVDDEPMARRGIRQLLATHADIVVIGECRDGREAVRMLAMLDADLVFLDIQMPGLDGMGVIRSHGVERMPVTVFVTAYDEFAVQAFEAHALDYLVKPLSEARFAATLERVRKAMRLNDAAALALRYRALLEGGTSGDPPGAKTGARADAGGASAVSAGPVVAVPTARGERLIDAAEIDWIEACDDYVAIHSGPIRYLVRESIASMESRLDTERFVRIHRSAIVRLDHVREWKAAATGRGAHVALHDGTELPVSRRRLARVKSLLRSRGRPA